MPSIAGVVVGPGIFTGLVLSLTGAQVCACVVSPLAVGAGGTVMAWAFGIAHGVVTGRFGSSATFSRETIQLDPFTAVTGGAVGLSAPQWQGDLPALSMGLLLAGLGLAIAAVAWLMGQPRKAGQLRRVSARRETGATLLGASVGAGIGLVLGLSKAFEAMGLSAFTGLVLAFAIVGGVTFGLTVWIRTKNPAKMVLFVQGHAALSVGACVLPVRSAGTTLGFAALAAATAFPDSSNHRHFPPAILRRGDKHHSRTVL